MRLLAIGIFVATLTAAAPASAQIAGSMRGLSGASGSAGLRGDITWDRASDPRLGPAISIGRQTRSIRADINDGLKSGQLTRSDARALRRESYRIDSMGSRKSQHGYSGAELAQIQSLTEALRSAVAARRTQGLQRR